MTNVLNRIDDIGETIGELEAERKQLRELYDGQFVAAAEITRLKNEIEMLAVDSVALDKIIKLIDEFKDTKTKTHSQVALYTLIWEISDTIDESGD